MNRVLRKVEEASAAYDLFYNTEGFDPSQFFINKNPLKPNIMSRRKMKVCNVTGIKTSENNFYNNHNHVKAIDNLRRNSGVSLDVFTSNL